MAKTASDKTLIELKDTINRLNATIDVLTKTLEEERQSKKVLQEQLDYMIANNMSVADAIDKFAQKKDNPFDFSIGFLDEYDGYHSQN